MEPDYIHYASNWLPHTYTNGTFIFYFNFLKTISAKEIDSRLQIRCFGGLDLLLWRLRKASGGGLEGGGGGATEGWTGYIEFFHWRIPEAA